MDYQIALHPDLNLSPADFVKAWNDTPECREMAKANLDEPTSAQYDPFAAAAVAVLSGVAIGVAANALYDRIKKVFIKKDVTKQIEIIQLDLPDGSRLLVVKIVEE